jgi:recombination protein RecR
MEKLIEEFSKMPGIGQRSAQRLTSYILEAPQKDIAFLLRSIKEVKERIRFCRQCNNLSEEELCYICSDEGRDPSFICVVEEPSGITAMERTSSYNGVYHVLHGALSPIEGVGPGDIKIEDLMLRVKKGRVREVIIATDFTTEGETTALYLKERLRSLDVKVTRLARGVPTGGALEYADMATLQRAFEERRAA